MSFLISSAYAQTAPASQPNPFVSFLPILVMFGLLYFLLLRPQMKRAKEHRAMVEALAKGDEVVTNGGLYGRIVHVSDHAVTLRIAKDTEVQVQRSAVAAVMPKGTVKDA